MRLIIREDAPAASLYISEYIIDRINAFTPTPSKPFFVLGLPTGSSLLPIYQNLTAAYRAGRVSFGHVATFNTDEYVGLPHHHPASSHAFMHTHLFSHVDVSPKHIHILDGGNRSGSNNSSPEVKGSGSGRLEAECAAYERAIRSYGGIDLFLGGVEGDDGKPSLGFNEPGSSLASRTRVKTLADNARFFPGVADLALPKMALTVGVQTVMEAKEVVLLATGARKAGALRDAVEGGLNHMCALSCCLQMHPCSLAVVDEDATLELRVKTVRYFKGVEKTAMERKKDKNFNNINNNNNSDLETSQTLLSQLRTTSLATPPQTPPSKSISSNGTEEEELGELTPDSMSSRMTEPF